MDLGRQELAARALYLVWHSGIITAIVGIPLVYDRAMCPPLASTYA